MSNRRQELYDRIRESSMDEVTREEMIRHGFWEDGRPLPTAHPEDAERRKELQDEIRALSREANLYRNPEAALKAMMKERMREAKARRIETKRRHIAERNARAAEWFNFRSKQIVHLGDVATGALQHRDADEARLGTQGLPVFEDMGALATEMGVELGELRFLAYDRAASKVTHYRRFQIPKKSGGMRQVSAPMPRLKRAQYWVLDNIVGLVEPHDATHGFRTGRSILTNAAPHQRRAVVVNYDLKDFFPSVGYPRVKGLFRSFGYSEAEAALFGLLCTEAERVQVEMDGETWHVATGARALPQGAPTSPAITNLLCRRLDRRLTGIAAKLGFAYTRYADDLTFSHPEDDAVALKKLDWSIRKIIEDEGFTLNEAKTRIMRRGTRQEVTGITVNDGMTVSRKERRKFRAYLHNVAMGKEAGSFRTGSPRNAALGYAQFLQMVHGDSAAGLVAQAHELFGHPDAVPPEGPTFRELSASGEAPRADWWAPAPPTPPTPERDPWAEEEQRQEQRRQREEAERTTRVPPSGSGRRRSQTQSMSRRGPDTAQSPDGPRGTSWGVGTKIVTSVLAAVLALPLPASPVFVGVAIYFIWFHRYAPRIPETPPQTRPRPASQSPADAPRPGVSWSLFAKIFITATLSMLLLLLPYSPIYIGALIYFVWFHIYRR
ncbi:MAG: reverse transcriptase family protein [Pseudomonadota bacterium]